MHDWTGKYFSLCVFGEMATVQIIQQEEMNTLLFCPPC